MRLGTDEVFSLASLSFMGDQQFSIRFKRYLQTSPKWQYFPIKEVNHFSSVARCTIVHENMDLVNNGEKGEYGSLKP